MKTFPYGHWSPALNHKPCWDYTKHKCDSQMDRWGTLLEEPPGHLSVGSFTPYALWFSGPYLMSFLKVSCLMALRISVECRRGGLRPCSAWESLSCWLECYWSGEVCRRLSSWNPGDLACFLQTGGGLCYSLFHLCRMCFTSEDLNNKYTIRENFCISVYELK